MNSDSSLLSSQHNQTSKDSLTQLQQQDFWTTDTLRARGELNWFQRCEGRPLQHRQFTSTSLFLTTMFLQSHCFPALSESSLLTVRMAKRPSRHKQRHTGQGRLLYSKCCSHPSHQRMRINAWFLQLYIPVMTEQIKTAWTVSQGLLVKKFLQQKQPPPPQPHHTHSTGRSERRWVELGVEPRSWWGRETPAGHDGYWTIASGYFLGIKRSTSSIFPCEGHVMDLLT